MKLNEELSRDEIKSAIISIRKIREKAKYDREKFCRICLENTPPLIKPCNTCRGSHAYVHPECLYRWRTQFNTNDRRHKYCDLCRSPYLIIYNNQKYAKFITINDILNVLQASLFLTSFILFILFLSMDSRYIPKNPYEKGLLVSLNFNSIQILTVIIVREIGFSVNLDISFTRSYIFCFLSIAEFILEIFGQLNFSIKLSGISYFLIFINYIICTIHWNCYIKKLRLNNSHPS